MALPDYIDRAATSAAQALSNFSLEGFHNTLESHVVGIAFDAIGATSTEGLATLDLLVRALARLHPSIALAPLGKGTRAAAGELANLAMSINPSIKIQRGLKEVTCCVVVGSKAPQYKGPTWYAGSDGWIAKLHRGRPVSSGASGNPFGAGAAACFAAANVFRYIFKSQLAEGHSDDSISLSMLTYERSETDAPLHEVDLGEVRLAGLGAIGNGAAWALARTAGLQGDLHLIDHETVELSNLQRYVLTKRIDVGAVKVNVAAANLAASGLSVISHQETYAQHLSHTENRRIERVAVALDTPEDRIALQASLPRRIINAWTQTFDLGVSRHSFDDAGPCLACLYMPRTMAKNEDEILADELRMPEALLEVRKMLQLGEPIGDPFVRRIAEAMGLPVEPLLRFASCPLREFRQTVICGGIALTLSGGQLGAPAIVPMAFQSALAGLMLAGELIKQAAGIWSAPTSCTRINLLRPLGTHLNEPMAKSAGCICCDPDFLSVYRARYS